MAIRFETRSKERPVIWKRKDGVFKMMRKYEYAYVAHRFKSPHALVDAYEHKLTEEEVRTLVAFLTELAGGQKAPAVFFDLDSTWRRSAYSRGRLDSGISELHFHSRYLNVGIVLHEFAHQISATGMKALVQDPRYAFTDCYSSRGNYFIRAKPSYRRQVHDTAFVEAMEWCHEQAQGLW